MKIATYNINGVNKRLDNLLAWLRDASPDVVCLQELKAAQDRFPEKAIADAGYHAAWVGEVAWNGVAILARGGEPIVTRRALPGDLADRSARYLEAAIEGILVASLYAPNGNPQPGPKYDDKLSWHGRFATHARDLLRHNIPVILAGDYNIAPGPLDVYETTSYDDNALTQPASRAAFRALTEQGWVDVLRQAEPSARIYTFWDYRRKRWDRNAGLRLDHFLASPAIVPRIRGAGIDREVRARDGASDHAPVWMLLD